MQADHRGGSAASHLRAPMLVAMSSMTAELHERGELHAGIDQSRSEHPHGQGVPTAQNTTHRYGP
jgi:hypothetical protein